MYLHKIFNSKLKSEKDVTWNWILHIPAAIFLKFFEILEENMLQQYVLVEFGCSIIQLVLMEMSCGVLSDQ